MIATQPSKPVARPRGKPPRPWWDYEEELARQKQQARHELAELRQQVMEAVGESDARDLEEKLNASDEHEQWELLWEVRDYLQQLEEEDARHDRLMAYNVATATACCARRAYALQTGVAALSTTGIALIGAAVAIVVKTVANFGQYRRRVTRYPISIAAKFISSAACSATRLI